MKNEFQIRMFNYYDSRKYRSQLINIRNSCIKIVAIICNQIRILKYNLISSCLAFINYILKEKCIGVKVSKHSFQMD